MTTYNFVFGDNTVPPSDYAFREVALSADVTLGWPDNTTGTDIATSIMDVTATSGPWSITLPSAAEVSTGRDVLIRNVGSNSFTVEDNAGGNLATVAAGEAKYLYITDNSTAAGTWSVFTYGTGTSAADASALAGRGMAAIAGKLVTEFASTEKSTSYSLDFDTDAGMLLYYTGGSTSWYLPDPSTVDNGLFVLVSNSGTGTLTVDATTNGGTIDGETTKQLQPGESMFVVRGPLVSNWITVGYGKSVDFQFTQLAVDVSAGSGDITITSSQAANKMWYFYNTTAASRDVVIPAVASIYFVRVGAIGATKTLTFTTGAVGSSSITLNASQSYSLYCDGTNVMAAQTVASTSNISLDNGSVANPSLNFAEDLTTGLYRVGAGEIGVASEGSVALTISASDVALGSGGSVVGTTKTQTLTNKTLSVDNNTVSGIAASSFVVSDASGYLDGAAAQKAIPSGVVVGTTDTQTLTNKTLTSPTLTGSTVGLADGSAGSPSLSFASSSTTGLRYNSGRVQVSVGGYDGVSFNATSASSSFLWLTPSYGYVATNGSSVTIGTLSDAITLTSTQVQSNRAGTSSAPGYTFASDTNTGMYSAGADALGFSTGGAEKMRISAGGVVSIANGITLGGGTDVLSVYDEASWEPTVSGITFTGTNTSFYQYTRIGRMVTLIIRLQASTSVAITNGATISLPTAVGSAVYPGTGVLVNINSTSMSAPCVNNSTLIYIRGAFTAGASESVHLTLTYFVA